MKLLKNNILKLSGNKCTLFPCYDWHIGEHACDVKFIKRYIKEMLNTENAYAFLGGDLLDTTIYGSVGNVHEQKHYMNEQKEIVLELLEPIKDRIIGALEGNHCRRMVKTTTFDIMMDICRELDIDYWGQEKQFAIQLGKASFVRFYVHHGVGAGSTDGGGANSMAKLHWSSPMADCVISGHIHKLISFPKEIRYLSTNGKEVQKNQLFVSCGTALGRAKYAQSSAYAPAPIGAQIITIKRVGVDKSSICNEVSTKIFL